MSISAAETPNRSPWVRWTIAGIFSVVMGVAVAGYLGYRDNFAPVVPGELYRAAQPTGSRLALYQRRDGIRTVINLRGAWTENPWYQEERAATAALGIRQIDVALHTHQQAPMRELRRLIAAFDDSPEPILIHCRQGSDRTSLAAAIYLVVKQGATPDEAMGQYRLSFGHTGLARGWTLRQLFECYRDWREERELPHSADAFRRWIAEEETIGYYAADIEAAPLANPVKPGEPVPVRVRVTNRSRYAWPVGWLGRSTIWVRATCQGAAAGGRVQARLLAGAVAPGASVEQVVTLPAFAKAGEARVDIDLLDQENLHFCEMGKGRWAGVISVSDATTTVADAAPVDDDEPTAKPVRDVVYHD